MQGRILEILQEHEPQFAETVKHHHRVWGEDLGRDGFAKDSFLYRFGFGGLNRTAFLRESYSQLSNYWSEVMPYLSFSREGLDCLLERLSERLQLAPEAAGPLRQSLLALIALKDEFLAFEEQSRAHVAQTLAQLQALQAQQQALAEAQNGLPYLAVPPKPRHSCN